MFLRKLTVLLVPLGMLLLLCLLTGLFRSMDAYFGSLLLGADQGKGEAGWPRMLQMEAGGHGPE